MTRLAAVAAVPCACAASLLLAASLTPGTAQASRFAVTFSAGVLDVRNDNPGTGDPTNLAVLPVGTADRIKLRLIDTGAADAFAEDLPDGCIRTTRSEVICTESFYAQLRRIRVRLADGDDEYGTGGIDFPVRVDGRDGTDRLGGGPENDVLELGEGEIGEPQFARGGGGDDVIRQTFVFVVTRPSFPSASMEGGAGDDTITASPLGHRRPATRDGFQNELAGGPGRDRITGSAGTDRILGDGEADVISAGSGDDEITGGFGNDEIAAGRDDDRVIELGNTTLNFLPDPMPDGADVLRGGPGRDTLDYSQRGSPLELFPNDGVANDGASGERDDAGAFEVVRGGRRGDFFFGLVRLDDDLPDTFIGGGGGDRMLSGDDQLRANDGTPDAELACNSGIDKALVDLVDPAPTGCEVVERRAVGEQPNVEVTGPRTLRRRRGAVMVTLRCPAAARAGCTGTVALTAGGRASFRLLARATTTVAIATRASGQATLTTVQRGRLGAKTTTVVVTIR